MVWLGFEPKDGRIEGADESTEQGTPQRFLKHFITSYCFTV